MRWQDGRRSDNIEDERDDRSAGGGFPGGFRGMPGGFPGGGFPGGGGFGRRAGFGGIGAVVVVLLLLYLGVDPSTLLQDGGPVAPDRPYSAPLQPQPGSRSVSNLPAPNDPMKDFVSVVLADTEDTWGALFQDMGRTYQDPRLVLFTGAVRSACGTADSAVGPFYCPADMKVYIDLSFYDELKNRFGAPGDFAQAYVIAHEIGHHVQRLLGVTRQVEDMRGRLTSAQQNALSVRMELQADCFAGVWAYHADRTRHILEAGDVEEALGAAAAIGDDRLQRQARGYVTPDSFTHGSSAQRVRWFRRGLDSGAIKSCDTFGAEKL